MKDIFIFFGPPGAGKGSLSQLLVDKLGWAQFSTGNACRKHIAEKTKIGKEIDFAIKSGKLVSDELVIDMVEDWISNEAPKDKELILDGCPRTIAQAEYLSKIIHDKFNDRNIRLIRLTSSDEVLIDRLLNRMICSNKQCQTVYSAIKDSTQISEKKGICDVCGSELVKRSDDTKEAVSERLLIYKQHANDVLGYFASKGKKVEELNAEMPLSAVFSEFKNKIVAA